MEFRYISEKEKTAWENLVQENPASGFMQSFFWSAFKRKTGWNTYKIGIFENNKLIGGTTIFKFPYSKTKNFLYIPEGPVIPYNHPQAETYFHKLMAEIDSIADLEGKQLTTHLRIEPRLSDLPSFFNKFQKAPYNMEPPNTLMIDLTKSPTELLADMKQKGRYNIKVADRAQVKVYTDSSETGINNFLKLYRTTLKRNQFEGKDDQYFHILIDHLTKNEGELFFAASDQEILATALVIFYGNRATYFFGASGGDRTKMAPYKLHWEIALNAQQKGYQWYDLWGIAPPEADSSHGWHGITQFKKKLGGKEFNFIGAYDFIYNEQLYQEFLKESEEV